MAAGLFSAGGEAGNYYRPTMRDTSTVPAEPRMILDDSESPAAPGGEAEGEQSGKEPSSSELQNWASSVGQNREVKDSRAPREGLRPRNPSQHPPVSHSPQDLCRGRAGACSPGACTPMEKARTGSCHSPGKEAEPR